MRHSPSAGRRHIDFAGIGLGVGDELGNCFRRKRWIYLHTEGLAANARNGRNVADEIVIELFVERPVDRVRRNGQEECIAVGRRACDCLGAGICTGARPVLDDEWLAEPLRQPLSQQNARGVGRSTRTGTDDDAHRVCGIGLCARYARDHRERGSARCQMQKCSAGSFIVIPPPGYRAQGSFTPP
jgi:hypothetical protein